MRDLYGQHCFGRITNIISKEYDDLPYQYNHISTFNVIKYCIAQLLYNTHHMCANILTTYLMCLTGVVGNENH